MSHESMEEMDTLTPDEMQSIMLTEAELRELFPPEAEALEAIDTDAVAESILSGTKMGMEAYGPEMEAKIVMEGVAGNILKKVLKILLAVVKKMIKKLSVAKKLKLACTKGPDAVCKLVCPAVCASLPFFLRPLCPPVCKLGCKRLFKSICKLVKSATESVPASESFDYEYY